MANGKVITAYFLFSVITAIIPGMAADHWIGYAAGATLVIAYWVVAAIMGDTLLLKTLQAEPLNVVEYGNIGKIVTSRRLGPKMGVPSLWMVTSLSPMVLSIGLNPKKSHLVFTKGLLDKLDDKVQLALTYRELESIRSGLTSTRTAICTLLWFVLLPGRLISWALRKPPGEPNTLQIFVDFFPSFFGAFLLALTSDKRSVYATDKTVQKQFENQNYLPYAFLKINDMAMGVAYNVDLALAPCCVINPNSKSPYAPLFKPHPATIKRIDRLKPREARERF